MRLLSLISISLICLLLLGCEQPVKPISQSTHAAVATYDADISNDGSAALIASVNHQAGFWDIENDVLLYNWQQGSAEEEILAVDISSDGLFAVTASHTTFALWSTETGKNLGFYNLPESDLRDIAIADGGRLVVMGLGNGTVIHVNLDTGRRLEFLAHGEAINSLVISPNGRYVLSGGNDYRAILWDSQTGQPIHTWPHQSRVILVAMTSDARYAFSSGNKADAYIWDLNSGQRVSALDLEKRQYVLSSARFSADGNELLTGAPSKQLTLWQVSNGKALQKLSVSARNQRRPSGAIVYAVGFTESGDLLSESSAGLGERWARNIKTQ